ncbi:MAG: xylulose kinase [Candidatus Lokiarchaeota archaeon]|nr:xylulose kinase [Candidatus Lokiarchaeota archaeon]
MNKKAKKCVIAVDHGTSGVKTAIVSVYGDVLGWEFEKTPLYLIGDDGAEQNPDEWWNAFQKSAKRLVSKSIIDETNIVGICVSSQWSCTVPVNKNGEHLMNAISWMDSRGSPHVKKSMHGLINVSGYSIKKLLRWLPITGGGPGLAGKGPIGHIMFIQKEKPEIYKKTYKFLDAKDYMNLRLTGKFASSYDTNHLLWLCNIKDLNNIHYEDSLIKELGLDKEKLPDMIKSTDILGTINPEVAKEIGINGDVPVISGSSDVHMAAIGSGAVQDYETHIYIGTSSWVICHVPFKKTDVFHNIATVPAANPTKYMIVNEQESAGACLTYLRDNILYYHSNEAKPHEYSELDDIAEKIPAGSENLIFTPWLYGERTPIEDHHVRGGFHNLSLKHNLDHAIRAVFEGVAFNSRWVLKYVEKFCKRELNPINIIGGGANSNVWCQIFADVLNRTIRRVKNPIQANARGAAFVASVGLGYINFNDISNIIEISKVFKPNPEHRKIYDCLFEQFVNIYKKNKKIYWKLNKR